MNINRIITAAASMVFIAAMVTGFGCGTDTTSSSNTGGDLPAVYSKVYGASEVYYWKAGNTVGGTTYWSTDYFRFKTGGN